MILITQLNSRIEEAKQICLKNHKKDNKGKNENKKKNSRSAQNLEHYTDNWKMVNEEKIEALKWIELSIVSDDKKVGTFEWPDISQPRRKIGDEDNEKRK